MVTLQNLKSYIAALIACSIAASCESPAAPTPNTDIGLRVWADVTPARLSVSDSAALLRVRIYVQNPRADTLRLVSGGPPYVFTNDPTDSRGLEQSFRIANAEDPLWAGPGTDYWGDSVYTFAPRATHYTEAVIRLRDWRAQGYPLRPGVLRVRSYYNGREGSSATFTLQP